MLSLHHTLKVAIYLQSEQDQNSSILDKNMQQRNANLCTDHRQETSSKPSWGGGLFWLSTYQQGQAYGQQQGMVRRSVPRGR